MEKYYRTVLSLWQAEGDVDFGDQVLRQQIKDAVDVYNNKFNGFKVLKLLDITKSTIILILKVVVSSGSDDVNVSRAVTYFSRYLYHECHWQRFSKIPKRLFTVVEAVEVGGDSFEGVSDSLGDSSADVAVDEGNNPNVNLKVNRLIWLYATKKYIEQEIKQLEGEGVKLP